MSRSASLRLVSVFGCVLALALVLPGSLSASTPLPDIDEPRGARPYLGLVTFGGNPAAHGRISVWVPDPREGALLRYVSTHTTTGDRFSHDMRLTRGDTLRLIRLVAREVSRPTRAYVRDDVAPTYPNMRLSLSGRRRVTKVVFANAPAVEETVTLSWTMRLLIDSLLDHAQAAERAPLFAVKYRGGAADPIRERIVLSQDGRLTVVREPDPTLGNLAGGRRSRSAQLTAAEVSELKELSDGWPAMVNRYAGRRAPRSLAATHSVSRYQWGVPFTATSASGADRHRKYDAIYHRLRAYAATLWPR